MGWPGRGLKGIAPVIECSEWVKFMDIATTKWATLRADGFKTPSRSAKGVSVSVSVLTTTAFDLDKKLAGAVANSARLYILTIAYKEAGRSGGR